MFSRPPLFPFIFRYLGWILFTIGSALGISRFYFGVKPAFLKFEVFAFYSQFIETKYFSLIENNFTEEIAGILILGGLLLIAFSKEKIEAGPFMELRLNALVLSIYINSIILLISILFVFGIGFVNVLVLNIFSLLFIYILLFRFLVLKTKKELQPQSKKM